MQKTVPFVPGASIIPPITLDGGIIAGGLGSRMNGLDKGLLELNALTFARTIGQQLRPHIRRLIINCNRNEEIYRTIADLVVGDMPRTIDGQSKIGFDGPLAGIRAILSASTADYVLFSPCDTPRIPIDYAPRMLSCLSLQETDSGELPMVVASDGERWHPLHILMPVKNLVSISEFLDAGERKMMFWLKQHRPLVCDFSDCGPAFFNVNSPRDLDQLIAD